MNKETKAKNEEREKNVSTTQIHEMSTHIKHMEGKSNRTVAHNSSLSEEKNNTYSSLI